MNRHVSWIFSTSFVCIAFLHSFCFGQEDYATWAHSRRLLLNTSSTGADISGDVVNFPILLRLNPGNFSYFSQTADGGKDVRFSTSEGTHLPYQIERWVDGTANNDTAEIWIRVETIYGDNFNQSIVMYWGKTGTADSSNGAAVFDTANGFQAVWHMGEGSDDAVDATVNNYDASRSGDAARIAGGIGRGDRYRVRPAAAARLPS